MSTGGSIYNSVMLFTEDSKYIHWSDLLSFVYQNMDKPATLYSVYVFELCWLEVAPITQWCCLLLIANILAYLVSSVYQGLDKQPAIVQYFCLFVFGVLNRGHTTHEVLYCADEKYTH